MPAGMFSIDSILAGRAGRAGRSARAGCKDSLLLSGDEGPLIFPGLTDSLAAAAPDYSGVYSARIPAYSSYCYGASAAPSCCPGSLPSQCPCMPTGKAPFLKVPTFTKKMLQKDCLHSIIKIIFLQKETNRTVHFSVAHVRPSCVIDVKMCIPCHQLPFTLVALNIQKYIALIICKVLRRNIVQLFSLWIKKKCSFVANEEKWTKSSFPFPRFTCVCSINENSYIQYLYWIVLYLCLCLGWYCDLYISGTLCMCYV